jgi:hypothetical protein
VSNAGEVRNWTNAQWFKTRRRANEFALHPLPLDRIGTGVTRFYI